MCVCISGCFSLATLTGRTSNSTFICLWQGVHKVIGHFGPFDSRGTSCCLTGNVSRAGSFLIPSQVHHQDLYLICREMCRTGPRHQLRPFIGLLSCKDQGFCCNHPSCSVIRSPPKESTGILMGPHFLMKNAAAATKLQLHRRHHAVTITPSPSGTYS